MPWTMMDPTSISTTENPPMRVITTCNMFNIQTHLSDVLDLGACRNRAVLRPDMPSWVLDHGLIT